MVILADDEERENEGDLVIPAQMATPEAINFMARYGRGLICLALSRDRVRDLGLELMPKRNESRHDTAFTVSIEAREGITTGISASDRARTISVAIDPRCGPDDLTSPGHVFPLLARDGGVLVRTGHTEASVDLARLAGLNPAAVICEIMNDDGTMARMPDLEAFSQAHNVRIATIADLIAYRLRHDSIIRRVRETTFNSHHGGAFRMYVYADTVQRAEHIALVKGDVWDNEPVPVRAHAFNILDDGLADTSSENTGKLQAALRMIGELGRGVVVVIREPFPVRLSEAAEPDAQHEDSEGLRDYGVAAQISARPRRPRHDPAAQHALDHRRPRRLRPPGGRGAPDLGRGAAGVDGGLRWLRGSGFSSSRRASTRTSPTSSWRARRAPSTRPAWSTSGSACPAPSSCRRRSPWPSTAGRFDGFVALGCVIRGETSHYEHVCGESARGLAMLAERHRIALGFGVVTAENREQAWERAAVDRRNKGADAAKACLAMMAIRASLGAPARG